MGFLSNLFKFGGGGGSAPAPDPGAVQRQQADAEAFGERVTARTPEELALLGQLSDQYAGADQNVMNEMEALRARGEDLDNVDAAYMERAYQPGFERLMESYRDMDQGIMEDLNARGVASVPGGFSEQEAYQRMLLSRDTKNQLGRNMLEAQNQAVNQKLGIYNARLAEMNQGNERRGQIFDPLYGANVVGAGERQANKIDANATRLGYSSNANANATKVHEINTGRKIAGQQQLTNMIGGGLGMMGAAMIMSDVNMKKDFQPANNPEQDLEDINSIPVERWRYQMEGDQEPSHTGGMAQDMPPDISPDGKSVDVVSYLGKATQAVQALTKRVNAFEQLLTGGRA